MQSRQAIFQDLIEFKTNAALNLALSCPGLTILCKNGTVLTIEDYVKNLQSAKNLYEDGVIDIFEYFKMVSY